MLAKADILEKCGFCGFEHTNTDYVTFVRNHVKNCVMPYCARCNRRLYLVPHRPKKG